MCCLWWRCCISPASCPPSSNIVRSFSHALPRLAAATFLSNGRNNAPHHHFSPEAMAVLIAYHWPGNVRELENAVERMVVLAGQRQELGVADLPAELRSSEQGEVALSDDRYEAARARFDHLYFQNLLRRSAGNVTEAARLAGISRGHLHRRMKELGVTP